MREVYTNIQLNCYCYSLGKLGHSGNHDHFFWAPTSRNFSEEQTQMKDGWQMDLQQKTVFFFATPVLTGARIFLLFPGFDADRL